ncbi:MAG TPA: hypothetical protein VGA22_05395 [Gemmatimonadales bacterium]|jgi:hypothetical protein
MRRISLVLLLLPVLAACSDLFDGVPAPSNLVYVLEPSGLPEAPAGLLLLWDGVPTNDLLAYRVYSRRTTASEFGLRGETTSPSFHDAGLPHLEYYVVAVNLENAESSPSNTVVVDERLRLDSPDWIESVSLDRAVMLYWSDNPFIDEPTGFRQYRVYSAFYDLDADLCGDFALEGTTVSPEFFVGELTNGSPRCFGVSAESVEGWESVWSDLRADTPRPDVHNEVMYAFEADQSVSGFRFELGTALGVVSSGLRSDMDFRVTRDGSGNFYFQPIRVGTSVVPYGTGPIEDLTEIDVAPAAGYARADLLILPGYGYVFQMDDGDGFYRYGAIRATHVGADLIIFDWSYQTDPGNPELVRGPEGAPGTIVKP